MIIAAIVEKLAIAAYCIHLISFYNSKLLLIYDKKLSEMRTTLHQASIHRRIEEQTKITFVRKRLFCEKFLSFITWTLLLRFQANALFNL